MYGYFFIWVQILIEMLPISSSTHVVFLEQVFSALNFDFLPLPKGFDYLLHAPILFVVPMFFRRSWVFFFGMFCKRLVLRKKLNYWSTKIFTQYLLASMGIVFLGSLLALGVEFLLADLNIIFEKWRFIGLLITVGLLIGSSSFQRRPRGANFYQGNWSWFLIRFFVIACVQSIALFPGISRMGATVSCAILLGFTARRAIELSFLLELPLIAGAVLLRGLPWLIHGGVSFFTVSITVHLFIAAVFSYFCLWLSVVLFTLHRQWIFGVYLITAVFILMSAVK